MKHGPKVEHDIERVYREFGGVIYAHCRRWLKNDSQAEDAVQEVFLRVLQSGHRAPSARDPNSRAAFVHWMRRVATNHCLDRLRRRGVRGEDRATPDLPEASMSPEGELEQRDLVRALLRRTPDAVLKPAVLFYVEGFEQLEIARQLGISRRTVANRLTHFSERMQRARANLEVASA